MFNFFKKKNTLAPHLALGILSGGAEALYCVTVASVMSRMESWAEPPDPIFAIAAMLMVLVFSVGLSGVLVFGYPAYLALQRDFRNAVAAVAASLATLFLLLALFFSVIIL